MMADMRAGVPARPAARPRRSEVDRAVAARSPTLAGEAAVAAASDAPPALPPSPPSPRTSFVTLVSPQAPPIPSRPARTHQHRSSDNIHSFDSDPEEEAEFVQQEEIEEEDDDEEEGYYLAASKPVRIGRGGSPTASAASAAAAAAAATHVRQAKRIRFRIVKLSKSGLYTERLMTLDPSTNSLVFQPLGVSRERASQVTAPVDASTGRLMAEGEKGFAMDDIKSCMVFDSALASPGSAASGSTGGASFSARLMLVFHKSDLAQRPYELLFQDAIQRKEFVQVMQQMYGIEVIAADETATLGSPHHHSHSTAQQQASGPATVRWIPDADCHACMNCGAAFSLMFRKHHCRSCGGIFCGSCSSSNASLPDLGHSKPQRVCTNCFQMICEVRKAGLMVSGAGGSVNMPSNAAAAAGQGYNALDDSLVAKNSVQNAHSGKSHASAIISGETVAAHRPQFLRTTSAGSVGSPGTELEFAL